MTEILPKENFAEEMSLSTEYEVNYLSAKNTKNINGGFNNIKQSNIEAKNNADHINLNNVLFGLFKNF